MNQEVEFFINNAFVEEIAKHLTQCDTDFIPPLSERVEIKHYAQKIVNYSVRFEAWQNNQCIGLIAVYCNDLVNGISYITSVSIIPNWHGKGIASQLLEKAIKYIQAHDFERIELEVHCHNANAINLYKKFGFVHSDSAESVIHMQLKIAKE
ncbi:MAG: GNAT family N-acetyltransferase [Methylococcales bacterium]